MPAFILNNCPGTIAILMILVLAIGCHYNRAGLKATTRKKNYGCHLAFSAMASFPFLMADRNAS